MSRMTDKQNITFKKWLFQIAAVCKSITDIKIYRNIYCDVHAME
jgi:hypothetical protein